jgi:hypothetical protein
MFECQGDEIAKTADHDYGQGPAKPIFERRLLDQMEQNKQVIVTYPNYQIDAILFFTMQII